jgi:hypothetical protein
MAGRIGIMSRWIVAAVLLCAGMISAAHAEKRVALVIGNSAYQAVPKLPNPDSDARLMSDTLKSLGFFVVGGSARLDLDKAGSTPPCRNSKPNWSAPTSRCFITPAMASRPTG